MCHEIENHFQSGNRDSEKFPRTGKVPGEKVVMIPSQPTAPNSGKTGLEILCPKDADFIPRLTADTAIKKLGGQRKKAGMKGCYEFITTRRKEFW